MTAGFVTGLGAATADAIYAALGAFSISTISFFLESAGPYLRVVGIVVLIWISWGAWQQKPAEPDRDTNRTSTAPSLWIAFVSTCGMTLANTMIILSFAAIFAGAGLAVSGNESNSISAQATMLVCGTFVGPMAWWLFLSGSVAAFRTKIGPSVSAKINTASAIILLGFVAWMILPTVGY